MKKFPRHVASTYGVTLLSLLCLIFSHFSAYAGDNKETSGEHSSPPFITTWRLLSPEQREEFIAGYLQGWSDAGTINNLALTYAEQNPKDILQSLRSLNTLYDTSGLNPKSLSTGIDEYFKDDSTHDASVSKVITAVRSRLQEKN